MQLANLGYTYAMKGAGSLLTPMGRLKEVMGGMTQVCTFIQVGNSNSKEKKIQQKYTVARKKQA